MKIKDAIDWIDIARMGYICDPNECGLEKGGDTCKVFHCDEIHDALVVAMEALEKQIPENAEYHAPDRDVRMFSWWTCGNCGCEIVSVCDKYCSHCGKRIDWGVMRNE